MNEYTYRIETGNYTSRDFESEEAAMLHAMENHSDEKFQIHRFYRVSLGASTTIHQDMDYLYANYDLKVKTIWSGYLYANQGGI